MSDDPKDTTNQNFSNQNSSKKNNNQQEQVTKKEVNIGELVNDIDNIKGKKTDVQNPELWEFPMNYPLSIIGHEGEHDSLLNEVKLILGSQFPEFDLASTEVRPSKTGRFHSVRVNLYLTNVEQVNILYAALDSAKTVRMVV
ncbi:hypothetical protein DABAL43B_1718 [Psychrobacter sp. DAB_AL43B]|nr:hypothetical protein DABAL43B_1718 [Psychrobacter sp. DAB_AL43B]